MKRKNYSIGLLALPCALVLAFAGCGDSSGEGGDETDTGTADESGTAGDEVGDEVGDEADTTGDGDGDTTDTGDGDGDTTGDGDGDTTDTGDGDGDTTDTGDGDGDTTGDGDGDTTGDGDGDTGDNSCQGDEFIEILLADLDDNALNGWDVDMSMLGEGMIIDWDGVTQDASISVDLDIPCDDDWHVWVRAINQGQNDSFFVLVDGGPDSIPIFEIACDNGPQQAQYQWAELNWREQDAGPCEYVEDPWVQTWAAGAHNVTLGYRESYAASRVWVTNTDQMPPDP